MLARFPNQLELGAESLNEQAPATVIGEAVATLDGWSIHFRMSKFRSPLLLPVIFPSCPHLFAVPVHGIVVPQHHGP